MDVNLFGQTAVNALMLASVYALVALGLTLVFGVLDIVNFAQGHLLLLGAYLAYAFVNNGLTYWIALPVVVIIVAILGALLDVSLFARVRSAPINGLLISIGLIAVFANAYQQIWGVNTYNLPAPVTSVLTIGSVRIPAARILVIVSTLLFLAGVAWFLRRTRAGAATRAVAQQPEAALLMGIAVERYRHLSFAMSAGLAALGGALLAAVFPIDAGLGDAPLLKGFIVLIIGGAGSPLGAVIGALMLGGAESFGITYWSSGGAEVLAFVLLIAVLFVRPTGLVRTSREPSL
ncbi:MAG: branched-chain amino acid transport system permease protein [Acidimicrobiaceae bacterium]|nr:branched-chain amino acid transport system permease protein [Acidimicrobiaceae bacterium]